VQWENEICFSLSNCPAFFRWQMTKNTLCKKINMNHVSKKPSLFLFLCHTGRQCHVGVSNGSKRKTSVKVSFSLPLPYVFRIYDGVHMFFCYLRWHKKGNIVHKADFHSCGTQLTINPVPLLLHYVSQKSSVPLCQYDLVSSRFSFQSLTHLFFSWKHSHAHGLSHLSSRTTSLT